MKYKSRFFFSLHSNRQFAFGPPSFSIIKNASQGSLKKWKENFTKPHYNLVECRVDCLIVTFDDIKKFTSRFKILLKWGQIANFTLNILAVGKEIFRTCNVLPFS